MLIYLRSIVALIFTCITHTALAAQPLIKSDDGTAFDPATGLTWMRCSMGQTLTGGACFGKIRAYTFVEANALTRTTTFAGQSDWRLPSIRELQTIVDRSIFNPAIDSAAFPNTPSVLTWSASTSASSSDKAWRVNFVLGSTDDELSSSTGVRLVRGEPSLSSLMNIARPTSDYVDSGNGTAIHTPTKLMWKRCAEGQVWTGTTCDGAATSMTAGQAAALSSEFAGQGNWRLPTEDELLTLVDYTRNNPAINTDAFPATPVDYFWSSSPNVSKLGLAWVVHFDHGRANSLQGDGSVGTAMVRLVRDGQNPRYLTIKVGQGAGTVTSSPVGISCSTTCAVSFTNGTSVTLTATPGIGNSFSDWSGSCTGSGTCVVNMIAAQNVTANFISQSTTSTANCVFNWAERTFPQFFAPASPASVSLAPYYYRYYSGTGNYLASNNADGHLLALGVATGGALLDLGQLSNQFQVSKCTPSK